jgi:hypothetical protein
MSRPRAATAEHGRVSFAVGGGTSPRAMFAELAHHDLPRASVRFHQVGAP